jgi:F-type H+-transporting ATPase subunit delta
LAADILQAKRFAQAVFEIARERNELDKWQGDLQKLAQLAQNSEFLAVMDNPKFSLEDKSKLLQNQVQNIGKLALNLAYLLTGGNNFRLISAISSGYQDLLDEFRGIEKAEVTTAVPLDENEKSKLNNRISAMIGKKIVLSVKVDPSIVGGIIVRVGGKIIDGSTQSQLTALRNELAGAGS